MNLVDHLLNDNAIRVQRYASDWKDAIQQGVGCLVQAKKATWEYYNAIVETARKNGPYFLLMPGVALPHARPEQGALATGFSLLTLSSPVNFGNVENDPVSILLTFTATDANAQVEESLAQAVVLFEDDTRVRHMMTAMTVEQMIDILKSVDFTELDE